MANVSQRGITAPQPISANRRKTFTAAFMATLLASTAVLFGLRDFPETSILLVDTLFCSFCAYAFAHRLRYLFLLHPIVVWILSQFYETSFLSLGDGEAYFAVTKSHLLFYTGTDIFDYIQNLILSANFKELYLGFIPNILIPDYLYGAPSDTVYFYWQACFHTILVSVCLLLAKQWCVLRDEYLFFIILFAVISPSFFELGNAPTRHYFTFFSVLLFYLSFNAIAQSFTLQKFIWLFVSIASVAVSRTVYLIPIALYCAYYLISVHGDGISKVKKHLMMACLVVLAISSFSYFYDQALSYSDISKAGAGTFGFLANTPFLSIIAKYVFALFSPFPWQKASYFIATIYGGNSLQFAMHVFSALTGLYFFTRIIMYARPLFRLRPDVKSPVLYGLIMSLSILGGSTGFHSYLLIFFPFFAPLFAIRPYQVSWVVPVGIAVGVEAMYTVAMAF